MIELKLPELGENIETAEVSQLLVKEGDQLKAGQNVMELESEKASFPFPCPQTGRVVKILVKAGDSVSVGQTLMQIEQGGRLTKEAATQKDVEAPSPSQAKPKTPAEEKTLVADTSHDKKKPAESAKPAQESERPTSSRDDKDGQRSAAKAIHVAAGPATRRLARELGVDLGEVTGSARGGRIVRDDVKAFVKKRLRSTLSLPSGDRVGMPPLPDFSRFGPITRKPLNKIARTSIGRLSFAWRIIPHVTQHDVADVTELDAARRRFNERHPEGPKITMTVLAVVASVTALKAYPKFNSSYDPATEELIFKDYYHVGVAVDTEHGLLVPVLRDANRKKLATLAAELASLAEKARQRALAPAEMEGATFTITNLGGIGGGFFTPIINYPEVAILGLGRAEQNKKKLRLPLSLSYDHRVINGADGARFLSKICALLGDTFSLLSEGG